MNKLILMRHGEAEMIAARDDQRRLTGHGRQEADKAACDLLTYQVDVEQLLVSPYVRARETAAIVAARLGGVAMLISEQVTPVSRTPAAVVAIETAFRRIDCGMVVTHQPLISSLVYFYTGIEQPMSTAAIAIIQGELFEQECCELTCVI